MNYLKKTEIAFMAIGLLLLVSTGYFYTKQSSFLANAMEADGQVVDIVRKRRNPDQGVRYTYYPIVKFTDVGGGSYEFKSNIGSSHSQYSKKENVKVLYLPDDPAVAIINDVWARLGWVYAMGILGTVFSIIGGRIYLRRTHRS